LLRGCSRARLLARTDPVGAENPVTSCDLRIFMDEAAEPVPTHNTDVCAEGRRMPTPAGGLWCSDRWGRWESQ
jgi:hypothetical protein